MILMWSCPGNMPKYYPGLRDMFSRVICLSDLGNILAYYLDKTTLLYKGWLSCIKSILNECGLSHFHSNPKSLKNSLLLRLRKCPRCKFETKQWSQQLQASDKMRTYRLFKNVFKFEKYISVVNSDTDRVSMTRFRNSNHQLQIEIGRYTIPKTPINDRTCKNCNLSSVEDELHFLLNCSKYSHLRGELVSRCFNKNITNTLNIDSRFIWLLSNEDTEVCRSMAKYLNLCIFAKNKCVNFLLLYMSRYFLILLAYTVEEQTRKNSNFPVRGIFKNPREIIVNIFR